MEKRYILVSAFLLYLTSCGPTTHKPDSSLAPTSTDATLTDDAVHANENPPESFDISSSCSWHVRRSHQIAYWSWRNGCDFKTYGAGGASSTERWIQPSGRGCPKSKERYKATASRFLKRYLMPSKCRKNKGLHRWFLGAG